LNLDQNIEIAIKASIHAGKAIMEIYASPDFETEIKEDNSPLTKADKESNKVIMSYLQKTNIPIISEENKMLDYAERKNWNVCWLVDPLDGTKEFIKRNGEFTVNIALIIAGTPILGVIYVPVTKEVYYANVQAKVAFKDVLNNTEETNTLFSEESQLRLSGNQNKELIKVVGSRSHMNEQTEKFIEDLKQKHDQVEIVSKGSSLKFCLVAEGKADVYPRIAPTMEWDTGAGHAICKAVGLKVTQWGSDNELSYNKENLLNPYFLVH
jgi:3'(2'), 5'-bisphosphate nucleotidase